MLQVGQQSEEVSDYRLIIVSNRLPVALTKVDTGQWHVQPSPGGLVTALSPLLSERGGLWVGWPGTVEEVEPE